RIADGLAVHVGQRLDRRIRWHEPIDLRLTGHLGRKDAKRCALAVSAEHSRDAARHREIDRTADDAPYHLGTGTGEEKVQIEPVLLEDTGLLTDLADRGVPGAALRDGKLERVLAGGRPDERDSSSAEQD